MLLVRVGTSRLVESRMGAVAGAMRHRSVSHPRSSNWTCRSPASGSPTGFTVRHTTAARGGRGPWRSLRGREVYFPRVAGPTGLDGPMPSPKVATRCGFATVENVRTTCRAPTSITETELSNLFGTRSNLPSPVRAWSRVSSPAPTAIDGSCCGR
jgi:hypothetical protein